jgi:DNA polymerase III gamma/tau subunit
MSLHDNANAQTDTTFMDDGNEIKTKPMTSTTATENKMKDVNKKKDIQDAVVVADEIVDGAAEELIELLNEGYKLPDSGIRALNEVKEMEGLLSERGFSESLLKEAFGNGGKVIKKYQDLMYRGDTETMLPYVINKAYELYLAKQKQD